MLTKQELISIAIAMTESNQLAALNDPSFPSNQMCLHDDAPLFRRMVAITKELYDGFDYARTPEFLKSSEGKSDAYRAMRLKMLTSQRKAEMLKRFGDALAGILESDEVYELTEPGKHERLKELRTLLLEVSNVSGASVL